MITEKGWGNHNVLRLTRLMEFIYSINHPQSASILKKIEEIEKIPNISDTTKKIWKFCKEKINAQILIAKTKSDELSSEEVKNAISLLSNHTRAAPPYYSGVGIKASLSDDGQSLQILDVAAGGAAANAGIAVSSGNITHINVNGKEIPIKDLLDLEPNRMTRVINLMRFGNQEGEGRGIGQNVAIKTSDGKTHNLTIGLIETPLARGKFAAYEGRKNVSFAENIQSSDTKPLSDGITSDKKGKTSFSIHATCQNNK